PIRAGRSNTASTPTRVAALHLSQLTLNDFQLSLIARGLLVPLILFVLLLVIVLVFVGWRLFVVLLIRARSGSVLRRLRWTVCLGPLRRLIRSLLIRTWLIRSLLIWSLLICSRLPLLGSRAWLSCWHFVLSRRLRVRTIVSRWRFRRTIIRSRPSLVRAIRVGPILLWWILLGPILVWPIWGRGIRLRTIGLGLLRLRRRRAVPRWIALRTISHGWPLLGPIGAGICRAVGRGLVVRGLVKIG